MRQTYKNHPELLGSRRTAKFEEEDQILIQLALDLIR